MINLSDYDCYIDDDLDDGHPYLYILSFFGVVVYVGSSINPKSRVYAHSRNGKIKFDKVELIKCLKSSSRYLEEGELIRKHNPEFNTNIPSGKYTKCSPVDIDSMHVDDTPLLKNIRIAMANKGIQKQTELCELTGLSKFTINKIFKDQSKLSLASLRTIANALDTTESELLKKDN